MIPIWNAYIKQCVSTTCVLTFCLWHVYLLQLSQEYVDCLEMQRTNCLCGVTDLVIWNGLLILIIKTREGFNKKNIKSYGIFHPICPGEKMFFFQENYKYDQNGLIHPKVLAKFDDYKHNNDINKILEGRCNVLIIIICITLIQQS